MNNSKYIGKIVDVKIDRPLGSLHPKHGFKYKANYGFISETIAPDGEELDAYVLGVDKPLEHFSGKCMAVIHRTNDDDDKLVIIPEEIEDFTDEEIRKQTDFQEKFFESVIVRANNTANKSLYLSGGGDEKQSFLFDEEYFSRLPQNGSLLYIPIALRGHKLYAEAPAWVRKLIDLHNRQDVEMETWENLENKIFSDLDKFDTIFIGGGNTWLLLKEIRESGFDKLLVRFRTTQGSIYGGSAGAIVLGKRIVTHDKNEVDWKDDRGLDLLGGYSVACHFQLGEESKLRKWSEDNKLPIICLPEETGSIVNNNGIKIIGTKPALKITPKI